mmetsp:Transcript_25257/g.55206  ORF Transcript_25257/g.55206 Transcript_25257/m.55206 type:complete len:220 (+) Transcript_25257:236-895(+)
MPRIQAAKRGEIVEISRKGDKSADKGETQCARQSHESQETQTIFSTTAFINCKCRVETGIPGLNQGASAFRPRKYARAHERVRTRVRVPPHVPPNPAPPLPPPKKGERRGGIGSGYGPGGGRRSPSAAGVYDNTPLVVRAASFAAAASIDRDVCECEPHDGPPLMKKKYMEERRGEDHRKSVVRNFRYACTDRSRQFSERDERKTSLPDPRRGMRRLGE